MRLIPALAGQLGSGKSFLLLQAVEYWQKQGRVVLYIPRGELGTLIFVQCADWYYQLGSLSTLHPHTYMTQEHGHTYNPNSARKCLGVSEM